MLVITWGLQMNAVGVVSQKNQCLRPMMILWGKESLSQPFKAGIGQHETKHGHANKGGGRFYK